MEIARGSADAARRRADVRNDHSWVAKILDRKRVDDPASRIHTASQVDFRPKARLSLKNRRFDHWTPQYLRYRLQAAVRALVHPEEPSLTPEAIRQLEQLLRPNSIGVEWGSGNTTRFFARRTRHLVSYETNASYYAQIEAALRREGITNVDYRLVPHDFDGERDEDVMHRNPFVRAVDLFGDGTLDYALIDSAPRGCLAHGILPKIKAGGMVIVDNANWFLPPPSEIRPPAPGSVAAMLGAPGSTFPNHRCWPAFARATATWDARWSSNGIQMTLILIKP
jgi:hypothetical protein